MYNDHDLVGYADRKAVPLRAESDLAPLFERIDSARWVLLGEASHGTHEFYDWRARITMRLIAERGFSFVAVEGDWPDCYGVNRYVKALPGSPADTTREVLKIFRRWPTWMWANEEVAGFAERLRAHNLGLPEERRAGFFGLDVYSLWESLDAVIGYLREKDPDRLEQAYRAYRCFEPYGRNEQAYAYATAFVDTSCEKEVVDMLVSLQAGAKRHGGGRDDSFDSELNALAARDAERYYRAMIRGDEQSWNVRDRHMAEVLDRLAAHHGPAAKGIVWAHNTHVGDARATDMAGAGLVNLGQLVREKHGDEGVVLVGFSSWEGAVIAGKSWGAPLERMIVPQARLGSWEDILHRACGAGEKDLLLVFDHEDRENPLMTTKRGHRAIGVVYDPLREAGNYVPTILPARYDALIHLERTIPLDPLETIEPDLAETPETFPSGE